VIKLYMYNFDICIVTFNTDGTVLMDSLSLKSIFPFFLYKMQKPSHQKS